MRSFLRQDDNFAEQFKLIQTNKHKKRYCDPDRYRETQSHLKITLHFLTL